MSFLATGFEFKHRIWFIFGIFGLGFSLYFVDRWNASVTLAILFLGDAYTNNPVVLDHLVTVFLAFGTLMAILGTAIRSWAEAYLHSSIVHDKVLHREKLIADGPFRYVRNPLYLGNVLLSLGLGMFASRSGFLVIFFGMLIFVFRLILHEEANLLQLQGEGYNQYLFAVPRLLPALKPRIASSGAKPNWVDGITGELLLWCGAVAMLIYTFTRSFLSFWIIYSMGFAIRFIQHRIRHRN